MRYRKNGGVDMSKDYFGKCGSCIYCSLGSAETFAYSTSFRCTRNGYSVKADEKPCGSYEPDFDRTNEIIEKFDR